MATVFDGAYRKVLLLGAIAAASAFVVTIVIVLVCVGCQRKSKSKHPAANGEKGTSVDMSALRAPNLNSMSKSDTRLHEINRLPCNGNSVHKNRPASMDLLLIHSRRSQPDLRPSHVRQLPQIPSPEEGAARDHTYTEVGLRNTPTRCLDDGLYESVGVREADADSKMPPAPPPTSANTPATLRAAQSPQAHSSTDGNGNGNGNGNGRGNGPRAVNGTIKRAGKGPNGAAGASGPPAPSLASMAPQDPVTAEYASIRKVKKVDKATRKENGGAESDSQSSVGESPPAPPPPPLPRSQEFPRKPPEQFQLHSFPKEAVFMGNGEQYIWKPPEEDDVITLHPAPLAPEDTGQFHPTAMEIAETYSTVCKPQKKKPPPENNDLQQSKTLPRCSGGENGSAGRGNSGGGAARGGGGGRGVQAPPCSQEEPSYEPGAERSWPTESDPAYATVDSHRKRQRSGTNNGNAAVGANGSATLKARKKPPAQPAPPGPPQAPPIPPVAPPVAPPLARALPGGENFYESIGDVKQGAASASTTTIFTFNDGMEMYVTGL